MTASEVTGTFRLARVRFQDAAGLGAIVVGERLDDDGRAGERATLQISGRLVRQGRRFYPAQTIDVRGTLRPWLNQRTGETEQQVAVAEWHEVRPRGAGWIDYVAANPAFKRIGRVTATRVWDLLGASVFDRLEARDWEGILQAAPVLSEEQAHCLVDGWADSGQERLIEWLDRHKLPRRLCNAILSAYPDQDNAVAKLDADPFRLTAFGSSWRRVDEIAQQSFGVARDDPRRMHAAVVHALLELYDSGHTAASAQTLTKATAAKTELSDDLAADALRLVYADGGFVRSAEDLYQLRGVYVMEREIAADLARRNAAASQIALDFGRSAALDAYERCAGNGMRLTDRQRHAVLNAMDKPLSIIIGGAGTGKTACLAALHHAVELELGRKGGVLQMALAGRAAKRMREATGRDAVTVAGFLHTVPEDKIALATHVVIDEASMLDVPSFYGILKRLRGRANLVLVGDDFQLPPVGAGKILHILAHRDDLPVTVLDRVWRQEDGNSIRMVATEIREGDALSLPAFHGVEDGVFIADPGQDVTLTALRLFESLGGASEDSDVCILTALRERGPTSALAINQTIHAAHFAAGEPVIGRAGDLGFQVGDRFVCDVNLWEVDLMNGSLGRILRTATSQEIEAASLNRDEADDATGQRNNSDGQPAALVEVDGDRRMLDDTHLLACSWGYALTCHRAQGSDFSRVVVMLGDTADRSWLYTAITRGRRQVVLVGTEAQLTRIIHTAPRVDERCVALSALLARNLDPDNEDNHAHHQ